MAMVETAVVCGASASRKSMTSPMTMLLLLLLLLSHLEFGVVVAAVRHQRRYNYDNSNYYNNDDNDIGSRWTTVASPVASSSFVFRDCGKRDSYFIIYARFITVCYIYYARVTRHNKL